jgi:hypothetical protein
VARALRADAFLRIRLMPKSRYSADPTSGVSHAIPTQPITDRTFLFRRTASAVTATAAATCATDSTDGSRSISQGGMTGMGIPEVEGTWIGGRGRQPCLRR